MPYKVMGNSACTRFVAEVHVQCARASQGDVVTPPYWSIDNPEVRVALRQRREGDAQFELREGRPEAVGDAATEGEVREVLAAAAMRIDEVRETELPRVAVRRRHPEPYELVFADGLSGDFEIFSRNAVIELEGALEAQALVHDAGHEFGMLAQLEPHLRLLCERRKRAAESLGGRLMPAREEHNALHNHLVFGQITLLVAGADQGREHIFAGLLAPCGDHVAEVRVEACRTARSEVSRPGRRRWRRQTIV